MISETIKNYVNQYEMLEHPEGGYYKETWRSKHIVISNSPEIKSKAPESCLLTSILFLLPGSTFSAMHRIASEELWNFHAGDPLTIYEIINGEWCETVLGPGPNQKLQHVVNPGSWFASKCTVKDGFSLCGCAVAPGFNFVDFEMADEELIVQYPHLASHILPLLHSR